MTDIEKVGKPLNKEPAHLEDVPIPLQQVDGFYLRVSMGDMTAEDGRKLSVSMTGFCLMVEREGRYILIDPVAALKRAANIILTQEDAAKQEVGA